MNSSAIEFALCSTLVTIVVIEVGDLAELGFVSPLII